MEMSEDELEAKVAMSMRIAMWLSLVSAACSMTLAVILFMEWKQPPANQASPQAVEQREVR